MASHSLTQERGNQAVHVHFPLSSCEASAVQSRTTPPPVSSFQAPGVAAEHVGLDLRGRNPHALEGRQQAEIDSNPPPKKKKKKKTRKRNWQPINGKLCLSQEFGPVSRILKKLAARTENTGSAWSKTTCSQPEVIGRKPRLRQAVRALQKTAASPSPSMLPAPWCPKLTNARLVLGCSIVGS